MKRDYYEILGVGREAPLDEIKKAYRKLAMQFHPDQNPGNKAAEEQFKEAAEAYAILADADKRRQYDQFGHAGVGNNGGGAGFQFDPNQFADFQDIFGGIFGGGIFGDIFGGGARRRSGGGERGSDLHVHPAHQFPGHPVRGGGQGDRDPPAGKLRRLQGFGLRLRHQPPGLSPVPGQRPDRGAPGLPADVRPLSALRRARQDHPQPLRRLPRRRACAEARQGRFPHPGRGGPGPAPEGAGRRRVRSQRRRSG